MKRIYSIVLAALAVIFTACSPEDFTHPDQNGIPSVADVDPVITVDQNLNQVTFSLPAGTKGLMPVWYFADLKSNPYSTVNGQQRIYAKAGDYQVTFRLLNRNGMSDDYKTVTFHIDNTVMDFSKYTTLLAGGTSESSKEWRMDADVDGHFGCGPSGTTGTEWWSATAHNKDGVGIYDNRLVFSSDYDYTYNPGTSGTMYVNCGISGLWPSYEDASTDYNVPMQETTVKYSFDVDGDDLYLVLPEKTPFLYVPNVEAWNAPRFKVESINANSIDLVSDNGSIAWHYKLTSKAQAVAFNGYNYEHSANIWRPIDENQNYTTSFWYAPGWSQIADPGFAQNGSEYTFTLPSATTDQWQAQCFIIPNSLQLNSSTNYDFSCIVNSSTDISHVTLKLTDKTDDGNFLFTEVISVKAYEDYVFYLTDLKGIDADCKLVLDFGGNGDNCTVTVNRITLKDHAIDDGTVLPDNTDDTPSVDWDESANLLKGMPIDISKYYSHGDAWESYDNFESTEADGVYTLNLTGETNNQWQCQYTFNNTGVKLSADKKYDFRVVINSNNAFNGATIKLTQQDDDNVFLTADRHELTYDDNVFEFASLEGKDISNLKIVFDFGGCPAGTIIKISKMLLQEHDNGGAWDAESADNMWTADMIPNFFYYAPGWAQIADPTVTQSGRSFTLSLPSATTDQWQAQAACKTSLSTSASENYDFQAKLTPNVDLKGVTVKLVLDGDDNTFYFADRVDLKAYETYTFQKKNMAGIDMSKVNLFFDFGGNPDNTEVTVSDIILRKH